MADPTADIMNRLEALKAELCRQGQTVARQMDAAVEAVFAGDAHGAQSVIEGDEPIDEADIEIERQTVKLLTDALDVGAKLDHNAVRLLLTIVKVNNELERIADCSVNIAERIEPFRNLKVELPPKFRVMANSVVGIMESANTAFAHMDADAARLVLSTDDATEAFKDAILHEVEERLVTGEVSVNLAFALRTVAVNLGRMSDHCTNIAEQVIYVTTGKIVRHMGATWTEPQEPKV